MIQTYEDLLTKFDHCTKELAQWNDEESLKKKFANALQERVSVNSQKILFNYCISISSLKTGGLKL